MSLNKSKANALLALAALRSIERRYPAPTLSVAIRALQNYIDALEDSNAAWSRIASGAIDMVDRFVIVSRRSLHLLEHDDPELFRDTLSALRHAEEGDDGGWDADPKNKYAKDVAEIKKGE